MRKMLISCLMTAAAAVLLTISAAADVIWEPENSFYEKHRDECEYEDRVYVMAGYDDSVTVWSAPDGRILGEQANGVRGHVQFRWTGGDVEWGYVYGMDGSPDEGWVPMDDMALVYDSRQFFEDYAADITSCGVVQADFDSAVLYSYPGGPVSGTLDEDKDYMPFSEAFSSAYTDGNGLHWGYVGYYMGHRNGWVCLDDPLNEHLDTNIAAVNPSAAQSRGMPTVKAGGVRYLPLILSGVLVAFVVTVTLLIIRKVRPKKE